MAKNNKSNSKLQSLNKLIGKWRLSGDAQGLIEYKWLEGGNFLIQEVDIVHNGKNIKGIELIGYLHKAGEAPSNEIWSRFYSFYDGLTLDYVYEANENNLTIWFIHKDSDNFYNGIFSKDCKSFVGSWQWPGGGYSVTGTRID